MTSGHWDEPRWSTQDTPKSPSSTRRTRRGDIVDESLILTPVATQGRGDLPQQTVGREAYEMHNGWRQQVGRPLPKSSFRQQFFLAVLPQPPGGQLWLCLRWNIQPARKGKVLLLTWTRFTGDAFSMFFVFRLMIIVDIFFTRALFNKKSAPGKKQTFTITMPKKTKDEQDRW